MMKYRYLLIILIIFLISACGSDETGITVTSPTIPTKQPSPTAAPDTPTPVPPTIEPTSPPTFTAIPIEPTATTLLQPTAIFPTATEIPPTSTQTHDPLSVVTKIQLVPILTGGLSKPVYLTHAFDERLFVLEQTGRILIIQDGRLLDVPFLDIQERAIMGGNEQGLLGLAFHPQYNAPVHPANGQFFVNYTNNQGDTVVASYQVSTENPNLADPGSQRVILTVNQPFPNHNGGQLQFGPDGYLYIGMGDGGSRGDPQGNGQNPGTLLGAMLRLDIDHQDEGMNYAIPPGNPFVNDPSARDEIWAIGFRNPWRFSFDSLTGDVFIADVGQNQWEEVHHQLLRNGGGQNYGWNVLEGTHCYNQPICETAGMELPVFEYDHGKGCSVTGGYIYRGQQFPSLAGNYFVADYCTGRIWSLFQQTDHSWIANELMQSGFRISSFGEDHEGELYVLDHTNGRVFQIQP